MGGSLGDVVICHCRRTVKVCEQKYSIWNGLPELLIFWTKRWGQQGAARALVCSAVRKECLPFRRTWTWGRSAVAGAWFRRTRGSWSPWSGWRRRTPRCASRKRWRQSMWRKQNASIGKRWNNLPLIQGRELWTYPFSRQVCASVLLKQGRCWDFVIFKM